MLPVARGGLGGRRRRAVVRAGPLLRHHRHVRGGGARAGGGPPERLGRCTRPAIPVADRRPLRPQSPPGDRGARARSTLRRSATGATFVLHRRDSAKVAHGGGLYQVMPVGVFQPTGPGEANQAERLRPVAVPGPGVQPRSSSASPSTAATTARSTTSAGPSSGPWRRDVEAGAVTAHWLGLGTDPLSLVTDMLVAVVFEDAVLRRPVRPGGLGQRRRAGDRPPSVRRRARHPSSGVVSDAGCGRRGPRLGLAAPRRDPAVSGLAADVVRASRLGVRQRRSLLVVRPGQRTLPRHALRFDRSGLVCVMVKVPSRVSDARSPDRRTGMICHVPGDAGADVVKVVDDGVA